MKKKIFPRRINRRDEKHYSILHVVVSPYTVYPPLPAYLLPLRGYVIKKNWNTPNLNHCISRNFNYKFLFYFFEIWYTDIGWYLKYSENQGYRFMNYFIKKLLQSIFLFSFIFEKKN